MHIVFPRERERRLEATMKILIAGSHRTIRNVPLSSHFKGTISECTNVVYACKYSYMHTLVLHVHMHSCSFIQDPATAVQSTDLGLLVLQAQQLCTLYSAIVDWRF